MTSHEPTPRLSQYQVGQQVTLKGADSNGAALIISAIRADGYVELSRYGKPHCTAALSHEVTA